MPQPCYLCPHSLSRQQSGDELRFGRGVDARADRRHPPPPSPQEAEEEIIMLKWATVIGIAALGATFILGFLAESIHVSWAHRPHAP